MSIDIKKPYFEAWKIYEALKNNELFVITSCSSKKIWDITNYNEKTCLAEDVYRGQLFNLFRTFYSICLDYMKINKLNWNILSAKYGLIDPKTQIENYNVTFSKKYSENNEYVSIEKVKEQFDKIYDDLHFKTVLVWGGGNYVKYIKTIWSYKKYNDLILITPFEGYRIGECLKAGMLLNGEFLLRIEKERDKK